MRSGRASTTALIVHFVSEGRQTPGRGFGAGALFGGVKGVNGLGRRVLAEAREAEARSAAAATAVMETFMGDASLRGRVHAAGAAAGIFDLDSGAEHSRQPVGHCRIRRRAAALCFPTGDPIAAQLNASDMNPGDEDHDRADNDRERGHFPASFAIAAITAGESGGASGPGLLDEPSSRTGATTE